MSKKIIRKYSNTEIVVVWRPDLCIHSGNCRKSLSPVFNSGKRPWIDMKAAATREIVQTVNKCPSKALTYYMNRGNDRD